jgi:hypothetical protein
MTAEGWPGGCRGLFATGLSLLGLLGGAFLFPVVLLAGLPAGVGGVAWAAAATLLPMLGLLALARGRRAVLFPLLRLSFWMLKIFGRPLRLDPLEAERMLVDINNRSFGGRWPEVDPSDVLLLLPHCLQYHECPYRLTFRPDACRRCGRCPMGDLMELVDRWGVKVAVATGGTSARRSVESTRPEMIVAVACPRDLSLGILDVYPIPVRGELNRWVHGQCFDTWVDVEEIGRLLGDLLRARPVSRDEGGR